MADQRKIVYEAIRDRFPIGYTFEQFCRDFLNWYFEYIYKDAQCIGATLSRNGFIHIAISRPYRKRWASRGEIKFLITNAMKDGKAFTTIFRNDEFRINFAKRLGFTMIEDGDIQTYEVKHENLWK